MSFDKTCLEGGRPCECTLGIACLCGGEEAVHDVSLEKLKDCGGNVCYNRACVSCHPSLKRFYNTYTTYQPAEQGVAPDWYEPGMRLEFRWTYIDDTFTPLCSPPIWDTDAEYRTLNTYIAAEADPAGAAEELSLPDDDDTRREFPMFDGLVAYFPNALAEVSKVSKIGNDQHNPGEPMHWARDKSLDHENKIMRHLVDAGKLDGRGVRHTARLAWRALAMLQEELERDEGLPPSRGSTDRPF